MDIDGSLPRGAMITLIALVLILLTALIGGAFIAAFGPLNEHTSVDPTTGTETVISWGINEVPEDVDVSSTTGQALNFDGQDDRVELNVTDGVDRGPWTVCAYPTLAASANQNSTMDVVAVENGNIQLEYDAGQWAVYYDNGTADAVVRAPAPTPTTATAVCGRYTGTELELWRNGSMVGNDTLTESVSSRNVSTTWNGTIDEIRISNSSVASSELSGYASDPTIPFENSQRVARLMLDEGSGSTTHVFFLGGSADIIGATWTDGVSKQYLTEGTDYEWGTNPWSITLKAASVYAGAPILHIYYTDAPYFGGAIVSLTGSVGSAIILFGVSLIAIPVVAVVVLIRRSGLVRGGNSRNWRNR